MSLIFVSSATLLLVCVALWLGRVLWRGSTSDSDIEHHAVNATVLRDQLVALERDFANGSLSSRDFAAPKQALLRRLLQESEPITRSEYHTSELHSLIPISSAFFFLYTTLSFPFSIFFFFSLLFLSF